MIPFPILYSTYNEHHVSHSYAEITSKEGSSKYSEQRIAAAKASLQIIIRNMMLRRNLDMRKHIDMCNHYTQICRGFSEKAIHFSFTKCCCIFSCLHQIFIQYSISLTNPRHSPWFSLHRAHQSDHPTQSEIETLIVLRKLVFLT